MNLRGVLFTILSLYINIHVIAQDDVINKKWMELVNPSVKVAGELEYSDLLAEDDELDPEQFAEQFEKAESFIIEGKYKEAIKQLNYLVFRMPTYGYPRYLRGLSYRELKKYDSALYDFKEVLATKQLGIHGPTRMAMGTLELKRRDYSEAMEQFDFAQKLMKNSAEPIHKKGIVSIGQGRIPRAKRYFEESIRADSTFYPSYVLKALIYISNYRLGAALNEINDVLSIDSTNYEAYLLSGLLCDLKFKSEKDACYEGLEVAINLYPELPAAYWLYGYIQLEDGLYKEGFKNLAKSLELSEEKYVMGEDEGDDIIELIDRGISYVYEHISDIPEDQLKSLGDGYVSLSDKEFDDALRQFNRVLKKNPDSYHAHWFLGAIYDNTYQESTALKHYLKALESGKGDLELNHRIGSIYASKEMYDSAAVFLLNSYKADQENFKTAKSLGDCYYNAKNYRKAVGIYSMYLNHNRLDFEVLYNRSASYFYLNSITNAITDLEEALDIEEKEDFEAYRTLSMYYMANGDTIGGLDVLDQFIDVLLNKGIEVTMDEGEDGFWEHKNEIFTRTATIANLYNIKGSVYSGMGDKESALIEFNKTLDYMYQHYDGRLNRGLTLYRMGRYKEAMGDFNTLLTQNENYEDCYYFRGLCLIELNQSEKGIKDIKRAAGKGSKLAKHYLDNIK